MEELFVQKNTIEKTKKKKKIIYIKGCKLYQVITLFLPITYLINQFNTRNSKDHKIGKTLFSSKNFFLL